MNVKLAALFIVACLSLTGLSFANENNSDFNQDDRVIKNKRVCVTWGKRGAKLRIHSLFAPSKFIQIGHLKLQEVNAARNPVFLKNKRTGRDTNKLRGVNLANTAFQWSQPTITTGTEGRKIETYFTSRFNIDDLPVTVNFRTIVAQTTSTVILNGLPIRREVDDVQFSMEVLEWPFVANTNLLLWNFFVRTNVVRRDGQASGGVVFRRVPGSPGREAFIWSNSVIDLPKTVQVDGSVSSCVSEAIQPSTNKPNEWHVRTYFPKAKHSLFFDAIAKVTDLPPQENPVPQTPGDPTTPDPNAPPPPVDEEPTPEPEVYLLDQLIPADMPVDTNPGPSSEWRRVTTSGVTAFFLPYRGAIRLYRGENPDVAVDDYVQFENGRLEEVDPEGATASPDKIFDLSGVDDDPNLPTTTWQVDPDFPATADYAFFRYKKTKTMIFGDATRPVDFTIRVKFFKNAGQCEIGGSQPIQLNAGSIKFDVIFSEWPFSSFSWPGGPQLLWVAFITTRDNSVSEFPQRLATDAGQRFQVSKGYYETNPTACTVDGSPCETPVTFDLAYVGGKFQINHFFPPYYSTFTLDPILSIRDPNDQRVYPEYVPPAASSTTAIRVRDPHSQFAGASTIVASHASVALAVFVALAAAKLL